MDYCSTRDNSVNVSDCDAVINGISADGGLFLPREIPTLSPDEIMSIENMSYSETAAFVMQHFLTSFSYNELKECTDAAYSSFFGDPAPLVRLDAGLYCLELWHGPTAAFKDMALQFLPRLFVRAKKKLGRDDASLILVATSGDTGKAALEGFRDVEGTKIMVLYPRDGVSAAQRLQMVTQEGGNVFVAGIDGNFDDAQRLAKRLMTDAEVIGELAECGTVFSSANSINWGRLAPQIAYYFYAYAALCKTGGLAFGDKANFCVPSGNFGNILAGYYAKLMGLPIGKLICASNKNDVLTDFINTGVYDSKREFYKTMSPSMDILVSSNVERLVWLISGSNSSRVKELFEELKSSGKFELDDAEKTTVKESFCAYRCDEAQTMGEIKRAFNEFGYLCDPHTAVALYAAERRSGIDSTPTITLSTASPYKFADSVLAALGAKSGDSSLSALTNTEIPQPLRGLDKREVLFDNRFLPDEIGCALLDFASKGAR